MEGATAGSMFWLFGQLLFVPVRTFVFGMERLLDVMRNMQDVSGRGIQMMTGGPAPPGGEAPQPAGVPQLSNFNQGAVSGGPVIESEEISKMDKDLNDDMLKLVRFKVLFVKRDYEHAFDEEEALVYDNMDGSAFTAWKIAEFIQKLHRDPVRVPAKWEGYAGVGQDRLLRSLPEGDKKYLRVYYEVLERYSREKLRYEEDHLTELRNQTRELAHLRRLTDCLCDIASRFPQQQAGGD
jgi:hypothetical protein